MMSNVSGQVCSPVATTAAKPPSPARRTQAAAPSPNSAVATMLAGVSVSSRNAKVQSSTTTSSTLVPGRPCANLEAMEKPLTPPAQPRPNTGTRDTSERNPISSSTRASMEGVATPVEVTVTIVSTSPAPRPAAASAFLAASTKSAVPPAMKAAVRSGHPRCWVYHSIGCTAWRVRMPLDSKTRESRSKSE